MKSLDGSKFSPLLTVRISDSQSEARGPLLDLKGPTGESEKVFHNTKELKPHLLSHFR